MSENEDCVLCKNGRLCHENAVWCNQLCNSCNEKACSDNEKGNSCNENTGLSDRGDARGCDAGSCRKKFRCQEAVLNEEHPSDKNSGDGEALHSMPAKRKTVISQTERPFSSGEILDFRDKYMTFGKNGAEREFPYDSEFSPQIREDTARLYEALRGRGVMRADFLVCGNEYYLNEINAIPGSMANYLFEGSFADLLDRLIADALERNHREGHFAQFESGVLSGGIKTR